MMFGTSLHCSYILNLALLWNFRCLGSGVYRKSLVSMLNRNSSYYLLGTKPPRTYTKTGRFDEEIADALGAAKLAPSLKALAIAFGAFDAEELVFDFPVPENDEENSVRKSNLGEEDFIVLQHILEVSARQHSAVELI